MSGGEVRLPADRSGLKPRTEGSMARADMQARRLASSEAKAAKALVSMQSADLSPDDATELVSMVESIYAVLPDKDPAVVASVLDAAVAAQPPGGGRRGGGVLKHSREAIQETAETGIKMLATASEAADSAVATFISKFPAVVAGGVLVNGGFTVAVNFARANIIPNLPGAMTWAELAYVIKEASGSAIDLAGDLAPLIRSPPGVMAIASLIMRARAEKLGKSVWDLIKSDATAVASAMSMGARGVGEAAQGKYYAMLSAYAAERQRKQEATGADLMSAIAHLKPTAENKARVAAAEGLLAMKPGGRRARKTKRSKRRSTRRRTVHRMPKFVY
jgi:hypothetical protein